MDNILRCPSCGGRDVRRSQSGRICDHIMMMFQKTPFRCRGCSRRFYYRSVTDSKEHASSHASRSGGKEPRAT